MTTNIHAGETQTMLDAGKSLAALADRFELVDPDDMADGKVPVVLLEGTQKLLVPKEAIALFDERQPEPRARTGTSMHSEVDSFIDHVKRYRGDRTVIWANTAESALLAIYDYHPAGSPTAGAGWARHRAMYECPRSPEWDQWASDTDRDMSQDEFVAHIEAQSDRVQSDAAKAWPTGIELLEMARDLRIYTKGQFERRVDSATGEYSLVCKEEHEAHSTRIYREFRVALRVFEGGDFYSVLVKVRFRLKDGRALFAYEMPRANEIARLAFAEVTEKVKLATEVPLFRGDPEK